jgi:HK97 family phage major capsid protein
MKTVTQYQEEIQALMQEIGAINGKGFAENRDLNDMELEMKGRLMDKIDGHQAKIADLKREEEIKGKLERPEAPVTKPRSEPMKDYGIPAKDRIASLGEFAMAVRNASIPGGVTDPRLSSIHAAATGLGEVIPSDGGFLVQKDFSLTLLEDLQNTGIIWNKIGRRVPISGNSNGTKAYGFDETSRVSSRGGGMVAYWVGEAAQGTSAKPKFREIMLTLKKVMGLCYATDEALSDAGQLEATLRSGFQSEFGFKLDDAVINGTGVTDPQGVLNSGSLVSVAKETGQKANTIVAENVIKMYSRMFPWSLADAIWLININTLPQLMTMSIAVGTGGVPVYLPPGNSLANGPGGTLLGRPVYPVEQCPSLGTQGDILFGDFTNGYIVAEKGGLQTDMSIHLRFDYDESVFRFIMRVDGQAVRASALTPYKGGATSTMSHFIVLDTRS